MNGQVRRFGDLAGIPIGGAIAHLLAVKLAIKTTRGMANTFDIYSLSVALLFIPI